MLLATVAAMACDLVFVGHVPMCNMLAKLSHNHHCHACTGLTLANPFLLSHEAQAITVNYSKHLQYQVPAIS